MELRIKGIWHTDIERVVEDEEFSELIALIKPDGTQHTILKRHIQEVKESSPKPIIEKCPECGKSDKIYKATKSEGDTRMCSRCGILFTVKGEV